MDPGSNRSYISWVSNSSLGDPATSSGGSYHQPGQQYATPGYGYLPAEPLPSFPIAEYQIPEGGISFSSYPQPSYTAQNCQFAQIVPGSATFAAPLSSVGAVGGAFHVEARYANAMSYSAPKASGSKRRSSSARKRDASLSADVAHLSRRTHKVQKSASSSVADLDDAQSTCTRDGSDDEELTLTSSQMSPASPAGTEGGESRRGGGPRQNHSEIEKRRRDKMNKYITELSRVVPMCITMSHKLDKLTVLRMAVQHLKTIRGAVHSYTEGDYKPSFLSDEELKRLILQSADGFLFVVGCDRGRILYVSESVSQVLNYTQGELLGQSWFDILHPKDVAKVKEQLFSSDLSPRERFIDAKTMLPVKTDMPQGASLLCPGARRSFFCRMKSKAPFVTKEESDLSQASSSKQRKSQSLSKEKKFVVVHCTGYLKSWAPTKIGVHDQDGEGDVEACNLSCLVAVGRVQPSPSNPNAPLPSSASTSSGRPAEAQSSGFISRHAVDGKFIFVDQRATLLLGLLPQEMLGSSMYEYFHVDDIPALTEAHKAALQSTEAVQTPVYQFKVKEGSYIRIQSQWKSFRNPWTKEIECLVAKNNSVPVETTKELMSVATDHSSSNPELYSSGSNSGQGCNIGARLRMMCMDFEASKIGQAVADEVLDSQRRSCSTSTSSAGPSPASLISSSNASPFSNVGSPTDSDTGALIAFVGAEDIRRSALNAVSHPHGGLNGLISTNSSTTNNHSSMPMRNNTQLFHVLNEAGLHADEDMIEVIGGLLDQSQSPSEDIAGGDGNDEAAMAVVMSLLEADAGLGGPVDFSGLPWPLP